MSFNSIWYLLRTLSPQMFSRNLAKSIPVLIMEIYSLDAPMFAGVFPEFTIDNYYLVSLSKDGHFY